MKSAGRERRTGWWGIVTIALVLAAGCRDAATSNAGGATTTTVLPSTTAAPPTTAVSTTVVPTAPSTLLPLDQDPAVIDLAYVQRVLDEIDRLDGAASRILYREKRMTPEAEAIITATFDQSSLADNRQALENDLGAGLRTWRDPPADPIVHALRIVSSHPGCLALRANSDLRPRYTDYAGVQRNIGLVLQRNVEPTPAERQLNPSLWVETVRSTQISESELVGACR